MKLVTMMQKAMMQFLLLEYDSFSLNTYLSRVEVSQPLLDKSVMFSSSFCEHRVWKRSNHSNSTKYKMQQIYYSLAFTSLVTVLVHQRSLLVGAVSNEKFLTLTLREKTLLDKFQVKVQPILTANHMHQDIYLIRWLRAKNFDLGSAENMLRENLRWRKENRMDSIQSENWDDMISECPFSVDTSDKIGQPIAALDLNMWDVRRIYLQGNGQRHRRFLTYIVENVTNQAVERQEKGMNVTQIVVLLNTEGFNVVQHACPICLPGWIQFMQIIENYYPQWIDEYIVIEAPPTVQIVLNAVRPVLSQNTREAIKVFGPNKVRWNEYLDKKISRAERRKPYGGTKAPLKN